MESYLHGQFRAGDAPPSTTFDATFKSAFPLHGDAHVTLLEVKAGANGLRAAAQGLDPEGSAWFETTGRALFAVQGRGFVPAATIEAWRQARQTAWQTLVKLLTTGVLVALIVGASIKLKFYGGVQ